MGGLLIDRVSDHLDNVVKMKFTQMSLYRHCLHDKPSRPIRRPIPTGHRHCRWSARKPVRTTCRNSPQCTNSGMQTLLSRVAAQHPCRRKRAVRPPSQREFPFPDKHLRSEPEPKPVHLRHLSSHPCRELSKYREVSVDNAVNAITDSVAYKFYIFKTRHVQGHRTTPHRDPIPVRPRSEGFLAAAANGRQTAPTPCTNGGVPSAHQASATCIALLDLVVNQQETRKDRRPRCRRPATSASTTGRRAPKRDTRSHRKVSRNQQAGQRPARRNIGWHLMPMY